MLAPLAILFCKVFLALWRKRAALCGNGARGIVSSWQPLRHGWRGVRNDEKGQDGTERWKAR